MAVSGSVSLELLYQKKPTVILYWISRLAYSVQQYFRKVKYITLVNLLVADELFPRDLTPYDPSQPDAEKVPFPEYLTCEDKTAQIAAHVVEWLADPARQAAQVEALVQLRHEVADDGAAARAAGYILNTLGQPPLQVPRPHFLPAAGEVASALPGCDSL
jgi:lipid-A-disaccharide synthase